MSRTEFTRKTRQEALKRSHICSWCSVPFDRGYKISATRAAKPQFCSTSCRVASRKQLAASDVAERFWSRVDKRGDDDCWPWLGRLSENGYGAFDYQGKPHIASRFSYELENGSADPNLFVCHSCDNPKCVNPKHLWLGTHQQNVDDAKRKGRLVGGNGLRGSAINKSKLSAEQVREIKTTSTPAKVLAERFGVSNTAINKIRRGKNWSWLDV